MRRREKQPLMWRRGRGINLQGVSARFLSVSLWLSSHKAISLWRLIMPITKEEKQTVPSLRWHQNEEFAAWWLVQRQQVMDDFHLYRGSTATHQNCVYSMCACLILRNTWIEPMADVREHGASCATPPTPQVDLESSIPAHKNGYCSPAQSWACLHVI